MTNWCVVFTLLISDGKNSAIPSEVGTSKEDVSCDMPLRSSSSGYKDIKIESSCIFIHTLQTETQQCSYNCLAADMVRWQVVLPQTISFTKSSTTTQSISESQFVPAAARPGTTTEVCEQSLDVYLGIPSCDRAAARHIQSLTEQF